MFRSQRSLTSSGSAPGWRERARATMQHSRESVVTQFRRLSSLSSFTTKTNTSRNSRRKAKQLRQKKGDISSRPQPPSEIRKWRERRNRVYSTTGRVQSAQKPDEMGPKSGLFESPSKTEIRSGLDENHVVKACQNLARLKLPKKLPKRAQLRPKSVKIGQKSGLF